MKNRPKSLETHVALFRGINVGGKNKLPMKDLVGLFSELGCEDVRTYIQSGNLVFRASSSVAANIAKDATARIADRFGYRVPVILRTADALHAVARGNPFVEAGEDPDALHVMFLADAPSASRIQTLDAKRSPGDTFIVKGAEVYLRCPNGVGRSKLTNDYFDRALGTTSTMRNWRTVLTLMEMARV